MSYQPPSLQMPGVNDGNSSLTSRQVGMRVRLLSEMNPYIADNPEALLSMAMSAYDTPTLIATAGQHYAMQTGNDLAAHLQTMNEAQQRATFGQLTSNQQMALRSMGYQPPAEPDDGGGLLGTIIKGASTVLKPIGQGLGYIPGVKQAGSAALEALTWIGNQPGHIYRTVRSLEDAGQWGGLIGAIGGLVAVATAIPTGGASLAAWGTLTTAGMLGGGALLGAAGGSFLTTAATSNPNDWIRAFNNTWDGERSFDRPSQKKVKQILTDPRMIGLAEDLAFSDLDLVELAEEMAGQRDTSMGSQLAKLEKLAGTMAAEGSAEYQQTVNAMLAALEDPEFQRAVQTLVDGKMSPGRDLADAAGLSKDGKLYNLVSGVTDAAFTVAVDPTLMVTEGWKAVVAARTTIRMFKGANVAAEVARVSKVPSVARYQEALADAVRSAERGGIQKLRAMNASFERGYDDIVSWAKGQIDTGGLVDENLPRLRSLEDFTADHLVAYYSDAANLEPLLRGIGTVARNGNIQMMRMGWTKEKLMAVRLNLRTITSSLSDVHAERRIADAFKEAGDEWDSFMPDSYSGWISEHGVVGRPWQFNQAAPRTYNAARTFATGVPVVGRVVAKVGDALTSMTTMAIAGRAISVTGEHAVRDIRALSEMGRYFGMHSWARQAWADTILAADSVAVRMDAVNGYVASMMRLAGLDSTTEGRKLLEEFVERSRQIYGRGDDMLINGRKVNVGMWIDQQANHVYLPDIKELLRETKKAHLGRVLGVVDAPILDSMMTKVWKPVVLMRLGFIPRAAGEELAAHFARGGFGSMTQEFGARFLGRLHAFEDALRKRADQIPLEPAQKELLKQATVLRAKAIQLSDSELELLKQADEIATSHNVLTTAEDAMLRGGYLNLLPVHARPIARMAQRLGFEDPMLRHLESYSQWLQTKLSVGVLPEQWDLAGRYRTIKMNLAGQPEQETLADMLRAVNAEGGTVVERAMRRKPPMPRVNVANHLDSLLMGKPYSIRRMLMGGVHDDLVEAGREWSMLHSTTVMRELSAGQHGAIESPFETDDVVTKWERSKRGDKMKQRKYHRVRGERYWAAGNTDAGMHGIHDRALNILNDPAIGPAVRDLLARFAPPGTNYAPIYDFTAKLIGAGDYPQLGAKANQALREITLDLMPGVDWNPQMWRASLSRLRRSNDPQMALLADELDMAVKPGARPALDDLANHFSARLDVLASTRRGKLSREELVELAERRKVVEGLTGYAGEMHVNVAELADGLFNNAEQIAFARQFVHHEVALGDAGFLAQRGGMSGSHWTELPPPAEGMIRLYRGQNVIQPSVDDMRGAFGGNVADWVDEHGHDASGRWFSPDPEHSEGFGGWVYDGIKPQHNVHGIQQMYYVDVPVGQYHKWLDEAPPGWGGDAGQVLLPPEMSTQVFSTSQRELLYSDWESLEQELRTALRARLMDPALERVHYSLRTLARDAQGQLLDPELRRATVMLYSARMPRGNFDELMQHSTNPELLMRNADVLSAMYAGANSADTILVADLELATELHRISAKMADVTPSMPKMIRQERVVTDGRVHGALYPIDGATGPEGVRAWSMNRDVAAAHWEPVPDNALDPIDEWVNAQIDEIRAAIGVGEKTAMRAKLKRGADLDDGNRTAEVIVWRYRDGEFVPVSPTEEILPGTDEVFYNVNGDPIMIGDPDYFDVAEVPGGQATGMMHELISPMLSDLWDQAGGMTRWQQRQQALELTRPGRAAVVDGDMIPLTWSKVDDVSKVPARPTWTMGHHFAAEKPLTLWERGVTYGFDRVIGPAIDAIARTPMAFHAFANRFIANKQAMNWLIDPALDKAVAALYRAATPGTNVDETRRLANHMKALYRYGFGDDAADAWTTAQALGMARTASLDEIEELTRRVLLPTYTDATDPTFALRNAQHSAKVVVKHAREGRLATIAAATEDRTAMELLEMVESRLVPDTLDNLEFLLWGKNRKIIDEDPVLQAIDATEGAWETLIAYRNNVKHIRKTAAEAAATAAIADVVPYLDSHEFKTQFADHAKGLLPFWYAEENFLKRWARGIGNEGPAVIRRMQLTYMGMKNVGVVRTDSHGRDWFVYPGSGALIEVVSKMLPGLQAEYAMGIMFQSPTDQLLPGLSSRMGTPSFSPLVSIPVDILTAGMPELAPIQRSILGDNAGGRPIIDQIVPAHLRNLFDAVLSDGDAQGRYASAQMAAIAYLEAHGQGLPDNANAGQIDEFMRTVKEHARVIVVAQAIAGFATPGSPSPLAAGDSGFSAFKTEDIRDVLADEYVSLIQLLGVEDGTAKFLEQHPQGGLGDIINPLAYTVPQNVSVSGAPLPSTEGALAFYDSNEGYMQQFPSAGPWLLPQQHDNDNRSQYAYDQQTIAGLRKRRTPTEFLRAIKFKEAASEYFAIQTTYKAAIDEAEAVGNTSQKKALESEMSYKLTMYRAAHPVFREELLDSDGAARRKRVIDEMRIIVKDPGAPDSPHFAALQNAMGAFDQYKTYLAMLSTSNSVANQRKIAQLKVGFQTYMDELTQQEPGIMSYWVSILRPESSLD